MQSVTRPVPRHLPDHPLDVLYERACILADRVADGTLGLIDAVDMVYSAADLAGLVERFGDDLIQEILASAFVGPRQ